MSRVYSLRTYLLIAAAILLVPLLLVDVLAVSYHASTQRQAAEHAAEDAAMMAANAFDAEAEVYRTTFRALAAFPDTAVLSAGALRNRVEVLLNKPLLDLVIGFVPAPGSPERGSSVGTSDRPDQDRSLDGIDTTLVVSGSGKATLGLHAGPFRQSDGMMMLRMQLTLERFSRRLQKLMAQGHHVISIYGREGQLLSSSGPQSILPTSVVQQIMTSEGEGGRLESVGADGGTYVTFWRDMPDSDSYLAVSMEEHIPGSVTAISLVSLLAVGLLPIIGGALSAAFLVRILNVSHAQLLAAASAMGLGRRIDPIRTRLSEANVVGQLLAEASIQLEKGATALEEANERLERRIRERTRELHEKSLLIEETLNSLDQGIIHFDEQGEILLVNRHADELLAEQNADAATPATWADLIASQVHPDMPAEPDLFPALQRPHGSPMVRERYLGNGTVLEIATTVLADGSTVCSLSDVSHRVRQADELRRARARAEEANRAKDDFLANMSHELRTPLNAVLGYADLLILDTSLAAVNQERIRRLRGAAWGLLTLLNDVLDYSRSAAGELSIDHASFDILEVVQDALSIVQPLASDKKLALDVDADASLPRHLMGDPNRIRQILINLLNNAVKFTHYGFVKLSLQGQMADGGGTVALHVAVEDSGVGIPFDQQRFVFERFHQVNRNDTVHRGAGLGLAICRQLVNQMGGKIWLRSSPEIGTTFMVSLVLPLDRDGARTAPPMRRHAPVRILLADDVEIGRDVTAQLLTASGAEVDCVSNGVQATEAVAQSAYDLIILDLNMPVMDGYEAARLIRQSEATRHIPIVACSASPPLDGWAASNEQAYDEFLAKPLDVRSVRAMLDRHCAPTQPLSTCGTLDLGRPTTQLAALKELIGPVRLGAGLDELSRHLHELLALDLTDDRNAKRVGEIAHAGLTSARLLGFEQLLQHFVHLNDPALDQNKRLAIAADLQPEFKKMQEDVAACRSGLPSAVTA